MKRHHALPLLALTFAAGCHGRPANDVLVTVDGYGLTRRDLQADLVANHLPVEALGVRMQSALMIGLIDRKLLSEQARKEALDKEPDYQAMAARAQEIALVEQLLARWRTAVPAPSRSEVQLFMDRNPQMFADRVIYLLDELRTEARGLDSKALDPLHSMDAVIDYLHQRDHPFQRGSATLDTLSMGPRPASRIARLAPGEPFAASHDAALVIRSVVRSSPAPLADEEGVRIATQILERTTFQKIVQEKLKALRGMATITYPAASAPAR